MTAQSVPGGPHGGAETVRQVGGKLCARTERIGSWMGWVPGVWKLLSPTPSRLIPGQGRVWRLVTLPRPCPGSGTGEDLGDRGVREPCSLSDGAQ